MVYNYLRQNAVNCVVGKEFVCIFVQAVTLLLLKTYHMNVLKFFFRSLVGKEDLSDAVVSWIVVLIKWAYF